MMARQRMQGGVRAKSRVLALQRAREGEVAHNYRADFGGSRRAHAVVRRSRGGRYGLAPWRIRAPRPRPPPGSRGARRRRPRSQGAQPMRFGGLFRERSFYQSRAARGAYRGLRRGFAKAGLDVVVKTFYSPIPDLDQLPPGTFERRAELPGVAWDLDRQLDYVRGVRGQLAEFRAEVASGGG